MNINLNNGKVTINGETYTGNNIKIDGDKVIIDGVQQSKSLVGDITVNIEDHVENLELNSGTVNANNVGSIETGSGDVRCGNVLGNVRTGSGDVRCGNVLGNVRSGYVARSRSSSKD
jgi:hypothetical protein